MKASIWLWLPLLVWGCQEPPPLPAVSPATFEDKNADTCEKWKAIRRPWDPRFKTEPLPKNCSPFSYRRDDIHANPPTHFYCRVCIDPEDS